MKPAYRSTAEALAHVPALSAAVGGRRNFAQAQRLPVRVLAWWRDLRRQHDERLLIEALAPLGERVLQDLVLSERMRLHALAGRESQYERLERLRNETGGLAGRFGPW
ncbi:MAG TPA: hypothetical protein VLW55_19820 [Burkholderiaceae bacterium]|nr:hypothetical protein [Burkholderiaceae bacterium]